MSNTYFNKKHDARDVEMFDKLVSLNSWLYDDKMKFKQECVIQSCLN